MGRSKDIFGARPLLDSWLLQTAGKFGWPGGPADEETIDIALVAFDEGEMWVLRRERIGDSSRENRQETRATFFTR